MGLGGKGEGDWEVQTYRNVIYLGNRINNIKITTDSDRWSLDLL